MSSLGTREIYLIEDDTPDYGLPPRRPSPSLLRDCDLPAAAFQPHNNDVPPLPEGKIKKMKMKKKDEGDYAEDEQPVDDDEVMEIMDVKSEVKEEPEEVVFSDNSNGDEVQLLDVDCAPVNNNIKDPKEDLKWRRTVHRKKKQEIRERLQKKKNQSTGSAGDDNGSDIEVLEDGREGPTAGSGIPSMDNPCPCNPPDASNTSQASGNASNHQQSHSHNINYPERDSFEPINIHLIVAGQQFLTVQIDPHNPSTDTDFQMTPTPSNTTATNPPIFRVSEFSQTGSSIGNDSPMSSRPDADDLNGDSSNPNYSRGRTDHPDPSRESSESRSSSPQNRRREDRHDHRHRDQVNRRRHSHVRGRENQNIPRPRPPVFETEQELIAIIKKCRECKKKFATRDDAKTHYKKEHYQKHCPVCFALISCKGNAWKDHLSEFHSEDGNEMAKCPFCNADQTFEGMYNHIGKVHLVAIERQAAERGPSLLLPRFPLEKTPQTVSSPHILRKIQQKSNNSESNTQISNQTATTSSQPRSTNHRTTALNFHNLRSQACATVTSERETSSGHTSANRPNSPRVNTQLANAGPSTGDRNGSNRTSFKIPKLNRNQTPVTPSTLTSFQISRSSQIPVKAGRTIAPHNEVFLKIAYTQKPTPGHSDYLRMAEQTGLEVGIIKQWFEKKHNEESRQKKGNKRKY